MKKATKYKPKRTKLFTKAKGKRTLRIGKRKDNPYVVKGDSERAIIAINSRLGFILHSDGARTDPDNLKRLLLDNEIIDGDYSWVDVILAKIVAEGTLRQRWANYVDPESIRQSKPNYPAVAFSDKERALVLLDANRGFVLEPDGSQSVMIDNVFNIIAALNLPRASEQWAINLLEKMVKNGKVPK
ncbi:MAG: hypothetical protein LBP59_11120 [Planctomycetaceae bacterium]|jgi:hypothetical protein|nr:hypothetical protein [Planctomycetaceae bacterium]